MNDYQRLISVLDGEKGIAPPVICPGGMMSMVCREISSSTFPEWTDVHKNPDVMARAASVMAKATGFENLGVPFCVTVEAEAIGGQVDFGDADIEPRITDYIIESSADFDHIEYGGPQSGRMGTVLEAIAILKKENPNIPVIGNLTGPMSLVTSIMDPNILFRLLVKDKPFVNELMDSMTEVILSFGQAQVQAGADVLSIGDPTASGEILGPDFFTEFVLPSIQRITDGLRSEGARSILHICGNVRSIVPHLASTGADAFSFDAVVPVNEIRNATGNLVLMGNISTFLLAEGKKEAVIRVTRKAINDGIDIVSPSCGLGTGTPLTNIRALTDTVRKLRLNPND